MMDIEIKDGKAFITTPYNKDFVSKVRLIKGSKWNGTRWQVAECHVDAVREIMLNVYGETDLVKADKVKIKITVKEEVSAERSGVTIFGKTLSYAFSRDSGAKCGEDVSLISGEIDSSGSSKWWYSEVLANSVFIVSNVNKDLVEKGDWDKNIYEVEVLEETKEEKTKDRLRELKSLKLSLVNQITEIDKEIEQLEK